MKNKIYAVVMLYSNCSESGDPPEVVKCFNDYEMAQKCREELIEKSKEEFWMFKKCEKCNKHNPDCPFYIESEILGIGCHNRRDFFCMRDYYIIETELDDGKKD